MRHTNSGRRAVQWAKVTALTLAVFLPAASDAQPAQRNPAQNLQGADSLLTHALARAAEGDTTQALEMLERANKIAPKDPDIMYWRAVILNRTTSLSVADMPRNLLAWRLLERAEREDRKNARYAIEMGRVRLMSPLLRIEAERQFRRGLKIAESTGDPRSIAEAAYQIGLIRQRRYYSTRDRYQVLNQGMMFNPIAATSELHYTREFLEQHSRPLDDIGSVERHEAEELFRYALRALPTHEPSATGLLALLYDRHRYSEMLQVADPFLAAGTGSARIRLATGLAAYRLGMLKEAEQHFHDALDRMSPSDRNDMTALSRIVSKSEANAYEALSDTGRMHTDSAFWESADPLLSTPENEAWLEFMARNAYSDLQFTDGDMKQVGWKTDRGLIVARYGEPPQVATFSPSNAADAGDAIGRIITVWRWPVEDMAFVFTGPPAMNVATFAGNFRAFAEETRDEVPFSLRNVAVASTVDTIPMQVARFRGNSANDIKLVIAATTNPSRLYENAELAQGELNWTLRLGEPSRMKLVSSDTMQLKLPAPNIASHLWIRDVKPGRYRIRVEALDPSIRNAMAKAQDELEARIMVPGLLLLSDPLIGSPLQVNDVTLRGLNDVNFNPRGNLTMRQREQFGLYWEMYGLVPDTADGRVKYEVNIVVRLMEIDRTNANPVRALLGAVSDAVGVSPVGDQALGYTFAGEEALGDRDRVPRIFNLGLGSAPAGRYRIEITITDKVTNAKARTDRTFYLATQ